MILRPRYGMGPLGLLSALVGACAEPPPIDAAPAPVVYDNDDRHETFEETNAQVRSRAWSSIVAMVPGTSLQRGTAGWMVAPNVETLDVMVGGLCADQRFGSEPTAAECSGTLIDDDLVLTAAHCVLSIEDCQSAHFVFDYAYASAGTLEAISDDDVYACRRVVAFTYRQSPHYLDFAVVKLDRPVVGRSPAPLDPTDDALARGSSITVMGFPTGLPMKLDSGGTVLTSTASLTTFTGTPDTFAGNSGSGVFDASGQLVGLLVAGQEDYVDRPGQACVEVNRIDTSGPIGTGETMTYVHRALDALCDGGYPSQRLCGVAPRCGDLICSGTESTVDCPGDCGAPQCGDGTCEGSETHATCVYDCRSSGGRCSASPIARANPLAALLAASIAFVAHAARRHTRRARAPGRPR